ncbi:TetR/AcrR family transcriptional regulator [Nocardioides sp. NPDC057577]|uniref:TetR/AcrR family transcriptional regulator n=1 Tax=Nocardioides sp. NPDC057577 TaxID=3346171 RepID=UPI00367296BB
MSRANAGTKGVPRADRELQIVRAACEVFGTIGFAKASVAGIAADAGISKPLVYQYFGSKEGLFSACLTYGAELLAGDMERVAADDSVGLERGLRTLDGIFRILEPQPWLWRLFFDRTAPETGDVAAVRAVYTDRITRLAMEGVGELMALVGDDDPLDVSAMTAVWMNVVDSLVTWWLDHPEVTPSEMTARCYRLIVALSGAEPPAQIVADPAAR